MQRSLLRTVTKHMAENQSMKIFVIVWLGQIVSLVGSGLTHFGLGVWVFMETGSATQFAMIGLSAIVPMIVIAPIAGVYVDRWDRRKTMIFADLIAGLSTLGVASMVFLDQLQLWHILVAVSIGSAAGTFQRPAYTASTTLIVPKQHLGRAAGMVQLGEPLSTILAPVLAGLLIGVIGLSGIIIIDFVTFAIAMVTLVFVRFPSHLKDLPEESEKRTVLADAKIGWQYIAARRGLLYLMGYFLLVNFTFGFAGALYAPLILSFSGPSGLGTVMGIAGAGGILGSIALSIWGGPKKRVATILGLGAVAGIFMGVTGLSAWLPLVSISAFLMMLVMPFLQGASQVIWQTKTPPELQGRVFAFRGMVAMMAMPIAYLIVGPLADNVFEPAMLSTGSLADSFGSVIGVGKGRGIGLMFMISGAASMLVSIGAFASRRLRNLEQELPDVILDDEPEKHSETVVEEPVLVSD